MAVLLLIDGVLLSRLVYVFNDGRLGTRTLAAIVLTQAALCLLLFETGIAPALLAGLAALALLASERWLPGDWLNETRITGLLAVLAAAIVMRDHLPPAAWMHALSPAVDLQGGASDRSLAAPAWFAAGFLAVANEANLLIRSLFHRLHLEPRLQPEDPVQPAMERIDQAEYKAGRIIGILERWLMYSVLVVYQNINVIAFIMAAKGFARFRQMDERAFAEYVLIGTLASMLLTLAVAAIVVRLGGHAC